MSKVVLLLSLLLTHLSCSSSLTVNVAVNVDTGNQVFNYILFNNDALLLFVKFRILPLMFHPGKAYWWVDLLKVSTDHSQRYFTVFIILSLLLIFCILKCTGKIEEAAASCIKHPDVTQCITEVWWVTSCVKIDTFFLQILGAESECNDCIEAICKALHIPGCL